MRSNINDLTGQKFGMLTVIGLGEDYVNPNTGKHRIRWLCQCECGNTKSIQPTTLRHGKAQSCGCLQKKLASERMKEREPKNIADITGQRFGRLTAIERLPEKSNGSYLWRCKCDCGNETIVSTKCLNSGNTKSCGCLRDEKIALVNKTHGKASANGKSRLYKVWIGMRQRCNDPNHTSYHNYGGRGIRVCQEWDDFEAFESWAMSHGYNPDAKTQECTIDRIDVNGNYEPSNCRWVSAEFQAHNKRNSVKTRNSDTEKT